MKSCTFAPVMMKRRISMLMILLANMLILAHAVVPHHHHNKLFVAIVNILDYDAQDIFNHEHGIQADDGGGCTIVPFHHTDDGGQILLADIVLYELSFILHYNEDNIRRRPYVASGHTDFVARSKGLRAPPTC